VLDLRQLPQTGGLRFPCERSVGLHIVTRGRVYLHAPEFDAPVELAAGDIAVMARGTTHILSVAPEFPEDQTVSIAAFRPEGAGDGGAKLSECAVVSGAYQLWNAPVHPFFREMPAWFVLRADEQPKLGPLSLALSLLDAELSRPDLATDTIVLALLDVVFSYLLREMVSRHDAAAASWSRAVQDAAVRRVVDRMHEDCAQAWTLEDLAAEAGLSRTGFAERFRAAMGHTPLSYLRTVRLQRAMHLLSATEDTLEAIAAAVGYQDAFSFSKVFKREIGVSPRAFRQQNARDRALPWRIGA
jgi:AraC-like DNA-binding protein